MNTRNEPLENLSTIIRILPSRKESKWYTYFLRLRGGIAMGSWLNSWLLFVYTKPGGVEGIQNDLPYAVDTVAACRGVRCRARYVIPANYLLRYFYIQYIRERRLVAGRLVIPQDTQKTHLGSGRARHNVGLYRRVTAVSEGRKMYRVYFSDGSSGIAFS